MEEEAKSLLVFKTGSLGAIVRIGPEGPDGKFQLSFGNPGKTKVFEIHRPTGEWEEVLE